MIEEKLIKRAVHIALKEARQKKYPCFFPGCHGKAIRSHSQSKSSSLKSIQENGFVIARQYNPFNENPMPSWELIGLEKKASVFPGFCKRHDADLFKEVDSISDINISSKSVAYLAFRTFSMEMRKKELEANKIDLIHNNIKKIGSSRSEIHGNPNDGFKNCLKVTKPFYLHFFRNLLTTEKEPQMIHKIFRVEKNLNISCATFINPVPVFQQPIDEPQPFISFNILPRINYSLVIFSCAQKDQGLMNNFIKKVGRLEDLVFNYCEEIIMNPTFFNKIPTSVIQSIEEALLPWNEWDRVSIPGLFNVKLDDSLIWNLTKELHTKN